jgi:hypothetical protein
MTLTIQIQFPFKDEFDRMVVASGRAMKAELEKYYGNEENFCVTKVGDNPAKFPDGSPWAECTSWAIYVRRNEGKRAKIYGFDSDENPDSEIAQLCGGHDFAVVADRFIVDGWVVNVEGMSKHAVFDLRDPADRPIIHRLYGDPVVWLECFRREDLEEIADEETPVQRARAMAGVAPRT